MKLNVEVYIKKNTLVFAGTVKVDNPSPYSKIDINPEMTPNLYVGHYIKITSGSSTNAISYITDNTDVLVTLQNTIAVQEGDTLEIYRSDYQRLDLFKDEKISITSQIGNANDIGKLYTDYTQSFTIPASKNNNQILSHWYESSVDNGFDHRMRYDAYIEVNTHRFRDGNIQLERADKKEGFIESYTVTFYGNLVQLKDIFKDDKLNTLDYSSFNHPYNSTEVRKRITDVTTTGDIKYPLIGNAYKYSYQDATATDITTLAGAVKWNELFPAITLANIFLRLQIKYGIVITGAFFNLEQWKKLYLYLKPSLAMTYTSEPLNFNFTSKSSTFPELNLDTDVLTPNFNFPTISIPNIFERIYAIEIIITPQSGFTTIPYTLYVYKNQILYKTFTGTNQRLFYCDKVQQSTVNANTVNNYTFKISSNTPLSHTATLTLNKTYYYVSGGLQNITSQKFGFTSVQNTLSNIQIANYIPDIKIIDFITGIIKAFNLMIIPKPNNTYEFAPLELYYNAGKVLDITEYTYEEESSINKPKLFKSINFTYEESNNVLNQAYKGIYQQNYGDLIYNSDKITESATYDIKLPFENVLFELVTQGKQFQTATLIDKDSKPYIPKPMLIYCNSIVTPLTGSDRIYVTNSTGAATQITNYNRFSNEYDNLPTDATHSQLMTMNFGNEQSSWLNELAPQGLYFRNYKNFIDNLYNIKTRLVKVKALLPPSILGSTVKDGYGIPLGIALNDRLVIRNKRYIINSYTTDLTTGETDLELLTDYRGVDAASTVGYKFASLENIQTDAKQLILNLEIYLNDYDYFEVKGKTAFITCTLSGNNTNDITLPVTITENTSGVDRSGAIELVYYRDTTTQKSEFITVLQTGI